MHNEINSVQDTTKKRYCAWCKTLIGAIEEQSRYHYPITHGMCDNCANIIFKYKKVSLNKLLNELKGPILVIDFEGKVITANNMACSLLDKRVKDIDGFKGGEVIECIHSREPGGCGNTEHCNGCAIRNSVMNTMASGDDSRKVSAYQHVVTSLGIRKLHFVISTEKVHDVVLLRVDQLNTI